MKWLEKIINNMFKHLYSVCTGIFLSVLTVLLITMSAQYLGNIISNKILNNRPIKILFFFDYKNQKENFYAKELVKTINDNNDLKKYHIKIKQIDINQNFSLNQSGKIIFSTQKEIMNILVAKHELIVLNHSLFDNRTQKYLMYSKYDEYVLAEINNHFKIYIGLLNTGTSIEKMKIFKTLNAISSSIIRKIDLQPEA